MLLGDYPEQHPAKSLHSTRPGPAIGVGNASALRLRQLPLEFVPLCRELQKPLPPVSRAGMLDDEALPDQLAEDAVQALLGDAQNTKQLADRDLRVASDEVDHAMMGPTKIVFRKNLIRFCGEIAVGEIQQLDPLPHLILDRSRCDSKRFYVRHIDLSCNLGYWKTVVCDTRFRADPAIGFKRSEQAVRKFRYEEGAMSMIPFDDRDGFIWYDGRMVLPDSLGAPRMRT